MQLAIAIAVVLQGLCDILVEGTRCTIPYGPSPNRYFPVIASHEEVLFPNINRNIVVYVGDTVNIICPPENKNNVVGYGRKVRANVSVSGKYTETCKLLEERTQQDVIVNCTNKTKERIRITSEKCGSTPGAQKIIIGWELLGQDRMQPQIEICFDYKSLSTIYTQHILKGAIIKAADPGYDQDFRAGLFFSSSSPAIDIAYKKEQQKITLKTLFTNSASKTAKISVGKENSKGLRFKREKASNKKLSKKGRNKIKDIKKPLVIERTYPLVEANKYILGWGSESYLARGHLSPNADFFYSSWQIATFYYINAVPQWQKFNNGNWKKLENKIREQAAHRKRDVIIYTGTHEVLKLEYKKKAVPIYLSKNQKVPVPKYIWKIVHDPLSNEAVAFVLHNSPPKSKIISDPLCKNICKNINFVKNALNGQMSGRIDCCTVQSLPKRIHQIIPNLSSLRLWS